ncbi:hypothetical protein GF312_10265 [Candidatus Poribacteria bacterium]|nr:hypothetical protein [Candidatus Poribacteria bacterium]
MKRKIKSENIIASLDFRNCPLGKILPPLEPRGEIYRKYFSGWETPLTPLGGFNLDSGLEVIEEENENILLFNGNRLDRSLVYEEKEFRDCSIEARVMPVDSVFTPHNDRSDCKEALTGIVFRIQTSRAYYHFGIEGKNRAVLYRRIDDEWFPLAEKKVDVPEGYLNLRISTCGDGIKCQCDELGVNFFCTDTTMKYGKAGFRSIGRSRLDSITIKQSQWQSNRDERRQRIISKKEEKLGENIPDAVLIKTIDLRELGGSLIFMDFIKPGRYDMLISGEKSLRAMTVEGEVLWEKPLNIHGAVFSKYFHDEGRLLYSFTGSREMKTQRDIRGKASRMVVFDEMIVIRCSDGEVLAKGKVPELHETIRRPDYSQTSGNMTGNGGFDIVLREWRDDKGGGGINLWAYDMNLNLLWHHELKGAWYGHHYAVQFFDVDNDGRDELLAGGTLFDGDGNILWIHDKDEEVLSIPGGQHYDAVALDNYTDDEDVDPVAFLLAGSAGLYVVDGLTGQTRSVHRIGHAQGRNTGKVRKDIPGEQILAATRWGNMGILTLFSGFGDRLWTIQPDYIGQGATPVQWGDMDVKLIWTNTTCRAQAFYDGYGRRVKELTEIKKLWGDRLRTAVSTGINRMGEDKTDYICIGIEGKMYVFGPED